MLTLNVITKNYRISSQDAFTPTNVGHINKIYEWGRVLKYRPGRFLVYHIVTLNLYYLLQKNKLIKIYNRLNLKSKNFYLMVTKSFRRFLESTWNGNVLHLYDECVLWHIISIFALFQLFWSQKLFF